MEKVSITAIILKKINETKQLIKYTEDRDKISYYESMLEKFKGWLKRLPPPLK